MSDKKTYIGVTVGPIFDTMNLVSTPAALWASSYIFSYVCKRICEILTSEYELSAEAIITPYFEEAGKQNGEIIDANKNGIGLYHDRVIFEKGGFDIEKIKDIKETLVGEIAEKFGLDPTKDTDFLREYIMIAAAEYEAENPIMAGGRILDSLELSKSFVCAEKRNPILAVFDGKDGLKNEKIKELADNLGIDKDNWQLVYCDKNDGAYKVNSLPYIAKSDGNTDKLKKYKYYAIVRSDVDNMSRIISSLDSNDKYREFSGTCFRYCIAMANKVKEYGGVTIYSGGDDLLALLPCQKEGKTVFDFVKEANGIFAEKFGNYINEITEKNKEKERQNEKLIPVPTLSFGVFISYVKHPLYEALAESQHLLFDIAKNKEIKDSVAVTVRKHSGQTSSLLIKNGFLDEFVKLQNAVLEKKSANVPEEYKRDEKVLLSAAQKVELFRVLFDNLKDEQTEDCFANIFDAEAHADNDFVHKTLPEYFKGINSSSVFRIDEDGIVMKNYSRADIMNASLRTLKFFVEKAGERE